MGSFKFRLVTYFILLSLLPLLAASWAYGEVAARGETQRADSRLNAALRVASADYGGELAEAAGTAASLARAASVQRAFASHDRAALVRIAREVPSAAFYSDGRLLAGAPLNGLAARRSAAVATKEGRTLGRIVVGLPLDDELVERLRSRAGLESGDRLVLASEGEVVAGPEGLAGPLELPARPPAYLSLGSASFRAVWMEIVGGEPGVSLVAVTPRSEIDAAVAGLRERLLFFAAIALAVVALLAYGVGRTIVRSLKEFADAAGAIARGHFARRVRVRGRDEFASLGRAFNDMAMQLEARIEELAAERARVRNAIARFGEALAATHEPYALLPVIVECVVEATGAAGGRLVLNGEELARAGDPEQPGRRLEIQLGSEGGDEAVLLLSPAGAGFSDESRELAHWLASQASIALENARLHRQVERQAVTDGLTELPNRRQFEESLASELGRLERFGGTLGLILADLDDFKQINDRYGHQAGDDVLRAVADVLQQTVRAIDLPARYGGEEFAVLLPQTDLRGAELLAERLRRALAARPVPTPPGALVSVTASFGVAAFPDAPTQAVLLAAADEALYRAKAAGKNCVVAADVGTVVRPGH